MEEIPVYIETECNRYHVKKSDVQTGYVIESEDLIQKNWWVNLKERLQCLSTDVTHALLTISSNTIAVFTNKKP